MHVFDRLGMFFFHFLVFCQDFTLTCTVGHLFWLFIWAGLPPHLLFGLLVAFFRGTPILAGGIGVARVVVGSVFVFGFRFRANVSQRYLLVTRLG